MMDPEVLEEFYPWHYYRGRHAFLELAGRKHVSCQDCAVPAGRTSYYGQEQGGIGAAGSDIGLMLGWPSLQSSENHSPGV